MKKADRLRKENLEKIKDWDSFNEALGEESERGIALLMAAFMDYQLRELIANFLVNDASEVDILLGTESNYDSPLGTFSSRITAAYCLGLITSVERDNLRLIQKIRNKFAHSLQGLSFDEPEIVSLIRRLKVSKTFPLGSHDTPIDVLSTVMVDLTGDLEFEIEKVSQNRRTVRADSNEFREPEDSAVY